MVPSSQKLKLHCSLYNILLSSIQFNIEVKYISLCQSRFVPPHEHSGGKLKYIFAILLPTRIVTQMHKINIPTHINVSRLG